MLEGLHLACLEEGGLLVVLLVVGGLLVACLALLEGGDLCLVQCREAALGLVAGHLRGGPFEEGLEEDHEGDLLAVHLGGDLSADLLLVLQGGDLVVGLPVAVLLVALLQLKGEHQGDLWGVDLLAAVLVVGLLLVHLVVALVVGLQVAYLVEDLLGAGLVGGDPVAEVQTFLSWCVLHYRFSDKGEP